LTPLELEDAITTLAASEDPPRDRALAVIDALLESLERGRLRAAEPFEDGWRVNAWVKRGILLGFRIGRDAPSGLPPIFHFRDRETYPTLDGTRIRSDVRIVPGGTTVRRGAFLDRGVVIMPPAYVNVGAWVGEGSMIDSHALVGSCAQVGRDVHVSAAVQIGGVLEPIGALPVIVEDGVFLGGGSGIYEGTRVGAGAVLAPGVTLTRATPVFDLVRDVVHRATAEGPLEIPAGAVVVPGSRPASGSVARQHGIQLQTPVVVKYRDATTDAAVALEDALR